MPSENQKTIDALKRHRTHRDETFAESQAAVNLEKFENALTVMRQHDSRGEPISYERATELVGLASDAPSGRHGAPGETVAFNHPERIEMMNRVRTYVEVSEDDARRVIDYARVMGKSVLEAIQAIVPGVASVTSKENLARFSGWYVK